MPNNKGTRQGLGLIHKCVLCPNIFEIFSSKQVRCRECAHKGKNIPIEIAIARGNKVYISKARKRTI